MNNANSIAWMPGTLLTDGYRPMFSTPKDIAKALHSSAGLRHREVQRMAMNVRRVDNAIYRMMRVEVPR